MAGQDAGADPWGGSTLEWATSSPPPAFGFAYVPVVKSAAPMWDDVLEPFPVLRGLSSQCREVLVTSLVDARPQYRQSSPGPSIWPLIAALVTSALFVGSIFTPWALVWGALPLAVTLTIWFWPTRPRRKEVKA